MNTLEPLKIQSIYHSSKENTCTGVNWSKVEKTVENLQHRITKAAEQGQYRKVRNLEKTFNKTQPFSQPESRTNSGSRELRKEHAWN